MEYTNLGNTDIQISKLCDYVEIKPAFVLDLRNQLLSAYKLSACSFCFLSFGILCEYQDTNGFTSSVRQS